jgi:hypothetical protein
MHPRARVRMRTTTSGHASRRGKAAQQPAPYPGAWMEADGTQAYPRGFTRYLGAAFGLSVIAPSAVLLGCLASTRSSAATRALAAATMAPYLVVFAPQIALETRLLNRSVMTPVLPLLFAPYRLWQLTRSLALVAAAAPASAPGAAAAAAGRSAWQPQPLAHPALRHHWLLWVLVSLLAFWVFDTACTLVWLPGMFDWQLQDSRLLAQLSRQQQQQQQQQTAAPTAAQPPAGACATVPESPAAAAKARHRRRVGGAQQQQDFGSGDVDAYGFGA